MASSSRGKKNNKKKSTSNPPIATPVSTIQYVTGSPGGMHQQYPAQPLVQPMVQPMVQPVFQPMGQPGPFPAFTTYPGQPGFGMQPVPAMAGIPPGVPGPRPGPGPGPVRPAQQQRQLEFSQAMSDFQRMFPKMDRVVIETVLRSNEGKVDETIDQLLKLNADIPDFAPALQQPASLSQPGAQFPANGGRDQPPPYSPPEPDSPFSQYNAGTPTTRSRTRSVPNYQTSSSSLDSLPYYPIESPPNPTLPPSRYPPSSSPSANSTASRRQSTGNERGSDNLPSEFLGLSMSESSSSPAAQSRQQELAREAQLISRGIKERLDANKTRRRSVDQHDVETQQIVEDERIALMLQNEEFLTQLQHNPEFMSALESDYEEALHDTSQRVGTAASPHSSSQASAQAKRSSRTSVDMTNRPLPSTPGPEPPARPANFRSNNNSSSSLADIKISNEYETPMTREEIEFRNKLNHMGKSSKTKLSFLAGKFNKKKRGPQKYEADPGPGPGRVRGPGDRIYEELPEVDSGPDQTPRNHHQDRRPHHQRF